VSTGEHRVSALSDLGPAGEREQQAHRLLGDPVLGVVKDQVARTGDHPRRPLGIPREQLAQMDLGDLLVMGGQRGPLRACGNPRFSGHVCVLRISAIVW